MTDRLMALRGISATHDPFSSYTADLSPPAAPSYRGACFLAIIADTAIQQAVRDKIDPARDRTHHGAPLSYLE